jgi:hypothetical protein
MILFLKRQPTYLLFYPSIIRGIGDVTDDVEFIEPTRPYCTVYICKEGIVLGGCSTVFQNAEVSEGEQPMSSALKRNKDTLID